MTDKNNLKLNLDTIFLGFVAAAFLGVSISYSDFYFFHFMLLVNGIFFLLRLKYSKSKLDISIFFDRSIIILIIIFLWYLLSLFWAQSFELGIKYIFYLFCGFTVLIGIVNFSSSLEKLNKLFKILSILIFIEIMIAFAESFTTFRMPISSYSQIAYLF